MPVYFIRPGLELAWEAASAFPAPLANEAAAASRRFGEARFPVMKRGEAPTSFPHSYVRWQPVGGPRANHAHAQLGHFTDGGPGEFRVYLRGQPLPNPAVVLHHNAKETDLKRMPTAAFASLPLAQVS